MKHQFLARRRLLTGVGLVALCGIGATPSLGENLTFVWHAGTCADLVYQISKDYPDKNITIVPDLVPYGPLWHDKIAANFAIHGDAFDFAMWDSQSTAEFAGGGHAYSINKVFEESHYLKASQTYLKFHRR
jgi:multiple sugar transport system substrate-binding protein